MLFLSCVALAPAAPAAADDPPPSSPPSDDAQSSSSASTPAQTRRREFGFVPLAGGDTDSGFGVGEISNLSQLDPRFTPYQWNLESGGFIGFRKSEEGGGIGGFQAAYQDIYLLFTAPQLANKRLRLEMRASYTREVAQRFYGIGNASVAPEETVPSRDFYERTHPTGLARLRVRGPAHFYIEGGGAYTYNALVVKPTTLLGMQMQSDDPKLRSVLGDARSHGVVQLEGALIYDTRDSEISPQKGLYHEVRLRWSPSVGSHLPYAYEQLNATLRGYLTLWPKRVVIAGRIVYDQLIGDPPFYELARYAADTFALGGTKGVRGIPAGRYYGKVKLFSNWEVRTEVVHFTIKNKPYALGVVGFYDVGRLWSDTAAETRFDGTGWNLKYGVGGGLRLAQGQTFVVRADIAWSPDAHPISGYVSAGHAF